MLTVEETKNYLRIDYDEDDALVEGLINSARKLCMDVLRTEDEQVLEEDANGKVAMLYCVAYLYEHREDADHNALILSLRALLSGNRKAVF